MSLRRSARVSAKPVLVPQDPNHHTIEQAVPTKKRSRKNNVTKLEPKMPPPPTTPNKRRKIAKPEASRPPPSTPTPSAISFMTKPETPYGNSSTGDIDDPSPPPTRPAAPHHTNATLTTPNGTHLAPSSTTTEESSPTKPPPPPTTNKTLLATACAHLLATAPQLRPVITQHPCPIFSPSGLAEPIDPFRSLTSGIIAQQVSGAAAKTIQHRFIALFPAAHCPGGFPPPALVAAADLPTLRSAGLSQRKAEYIHGLAAQFVSGAISAPWLMTAEDREVRERLGSVRGLGAWSVDMFMCFGLKRMDVFSVGDLGVQRGMAAFVGRDVAKLKARGGGKWKYMSEKEMVEVSERFRPYRSLFMWYMWRIEDTDVDAIQGNA